MEVLVLIDFEGTVPDELTVQAGDVVKNVTKASEEGWLEGELRGKRGIIPANFVKEVPVYLLGDTKREPRSIRTSKMPKKQTRKCEVTFAYTPAHEDELELVVGETIEILREIEDGWWMGKKNGVVGAFPSNFVKEIFVLESKHNEGKIRPKLSQAIFSKEGRPQQRASVRNKTTKAKECCQVMFDYSPCGEDELELKKGDIVTIITKETEDEGWWQGELNGHRGFFPDNFVMVIPADALQCGTKSQAPVRRGTEKRSVKLQPAGMEQKNGTDAKEEKPELKDLRSDPPGKIKLPGLRKAPPPPVKDKPQKFVPKTNDDQPPVSPKHTENKEQPPVSPKHTENKEQPPVSPKHTENKDKDVDHFDGIDVAPQKLSHPTANRAKPPQRRPPTAAASAPQGATGVEQTEDSSDPDGSSKKDHSHLPEKIEQSLKSMTAPQPNLNLQPKVPTETKPQEENVSLAVVMAEIKELRVSLDLLKALHQRDVQDLKEELNDERNKRTKLQEEVQALRSKH
ncbi:SH3 domain-containing protein 21 isoform X2 [Chanos chanos]|uniref:SH3 domain-containing protein 21 isoform X2 n=1 Tax=Chanos chanos TaxID=29144 RepID=A0A6J2W1A6_CHACN|nr:SH3 domain-containing protein 21 isoform X2 [Chanos chanos]